MRYLRTECRVIDTQKCKEKFLCGEKCWQPTHGYLVYEHNVIKSSDELEDVCDAFIVIHKELNGNHIIHRYNWLGKSEHKAGNEVYAAIWSKGDHDEPILKSVAKMNEKGEFEVL